MDIISPELVWIGQRCYRKMETASIKDSQRAPLGMNIIEEDYDFDDDDDVDLLYDITENERGFELKHEIPAQLLRIFHFHKRDSLNRIQKDTETTVRLPNKNFVNVPLKIHGRIQKNCIDALKRILILVGEERSKISPTHFVSFPFNHPIIKKSFYEFKRDILRMSTKNSGIKEEMFQDPERLHLTVNMLILLDPGDQSQAIKVMESCRSTIVERILVGEPLVVLVKGLEIMNDDPENVNVLYAKVHSEKIQEIAAELETKFKGESFTKSSFDKVKLHLTLMNTAFNKAGNVRVPFNAVEILKVLGGFDFGKIEISHVHISIRHSSKRGRYYENLHSLPLITSI